MKNHSESRRPWLLAMVLAVTLIRPLPAASSQSTTDVEIERFFESDYTWCDVQLLSSYWEQDQLDTKARIGRKIGWGDEQYIEEFLEGARGQAQERGEKCSFYESEFSYEDAEVLSNYWQMPVDEVKAFVEEKLFYGGASVVRAALIDAGEGSGYEGGEHGGEGYGPSEAEALDTYWGKGYTYCDARLVAAYWNEDVYETKVQLGNKLYAGGYEALTWHFESARSELDGGSLDDFSCNYADDYTWDDIETLSDFWDISIGETKTMVENKLVWGLNEEVQAALRAARG